ncbi:Ankyrin repeat family protein [Salix suchowensis]|nr:Ankyrin repeat family protein [Salix suchowensis]
MHKSSAIATTSFEDIQNPVQIATRGTVGSLVMQELKYFSQVESSHGSSQMSQPHVTVMASTRGSRRLPRICSVVEVSDCSRPIGNSGFSYRNLKSEAKKLQA